MAEYCLEIADWIEPKKVGGGTGFFFFPYQCRVLDLLDFAMMLQLSYRRAILFQRRYVELPPASWKSNLSSSRSESLFAAAAGVLNVCGRPVYVRGVNNGEGYVGFARCREYYRPENRCTRFSECVGVV
jgi:hypothetical protein